MKITQGQNQVTIPGMYQVLMVAIDQREHDPNGPSWMLMRVTIEQYHKLLDDKDLPHQGLPRYYTQSGETIYFWPASDVDCELEIQYHTHIMRA